MTDDLQNRRKRLRFRSWHRGTKEADLLLGSFADRHLGSMTAAQLDDFEAVLDQPDPVLYQWFTGESQPPESMNNDVVQLILSFRYTPTKT